MYALKVSINEEAPTIGGAEDLGVLSAQVTCAGSLGSKSHLGKKDTPNFFFRLGGLTSRGAGSQNENLLWLQRWDMKLGDMVCIEIVQVEEASAPFASDEATQCESDERERFERAKKLYLELRGKYDPET